MSPRFEAFFPFIIEWEGSTYENDPDDAGGSTKYGIDQRSHPHVDIRHLTLEQAKEIYWNEYWKPIRAEELPKKVGEVMMDIAVNNGKHAAVTWLQKICGVVVDGFLGPKTIAAVIQYGESAANALLIRRADFYKSIAVGHNRKFLGGWLNRNNALISWISKL